MRGNPIQHVIFNQSKNYLVFLRDKLFTFAMSELQLIYQNEVLYINLKLYYKSSSVEES